MTQATEGLLICQGESGRWFLGKDVGIENENRILYADFLMVEELGFYDRRDWVLEAAKTTEKNTHYLSQASSEAFFFIKKGLTLVIDYSII